MADQLGPPTNAIAVAPSDTALLPFVPTKISIGGQTGAQTLTVTMFGPGPPNYGAKVTVTLPAGMYDMRVIQVWSTGTTVTLIAAWGV